MLESFLDAHYGVVHRQALLGLGLTPAGINDLLRRGSLRRIRRGWYAAVTAEPSVERAVRLGGALTSVSALRLHGLWAPRNWPDSRLYLRPSAHFATKTFPHWAATCSLYRQAGARISRSVDSIPQALVCALTSLGPEAAIVLMDSALNQRKITEEKLVRLARELPRDIRQHLSRVDAGAQSGTETLVRLRLRARHIKLRSQVQIGDIGRVDFLVGERLVIEVDSRSHHTDPDAFARDRRRDRRLSRLGYIVVRVTYHEVMFGWDTVEEDILAIIRARRHFWPRRRTG